SPFASRPFHRTRTFPRGNEPRATVTSLAPTRIAIVSRSARRSEKSMFATAESQRQTGEKTLSMRVCEIGLGSSLRCCVTTKAVAVTTSSSRARIVGAFLFIGARLYAAGASKPRTALTQQNGTTLRLDRTQEEEADARGHRTGHDQAWPGGRDLAMVREGGVAMLGGMSGSAGGYWARAVEGELVQHSFWLFDTEEDARAAEATFNTLRD